MSKNEMAYSLTEGLYDARSLADELTKCRDAMAHYFLLSNDQDKLYCSERYEILTQIISQIMDK